MKDEPVLGRQEDAADSLAVVLPKPIEVQLTWCDEENVCSDVETKTITFCTEMVHYFWDQAFREM